MLTNLATFAELAPSDLLVLVLVTFVAGLVRGFAGFALSALMMAGAVVVLPPVQLIPICFFLEGTASLLMVRGGARDADMSVVWALVIGGAIGLPIGLAVTVYLPADASRLAALLLVGSLTILQLFRISHPALATRAGVYTTGLAAGFASGIASIGGMVVALYVLATGSAARQMRASLVMYLFVGMFTSLIYLLVFDVMNWLAFWRGLILAPVLAVGVLIGARFFRPSAEGIYKRFCLMLLLGLTAIGLARMMAG